MTMTFNLQTFLSNLPNTSGCYLMYNDQDEVIYVGKAKNLKRRVSSYFRQNLDHPKTKAMVAQISYIEIMHTLSETEAFILEYTLIKKHDPRYNIIFRDDKSYPYLYVSTEQHYPGLYLHRGIRKKEGRVFGPFPNPTAVYETLTELQKIFPIRQCSDTEFHNRSRPCLQHQIKRCSAPCVDLISTEDYAQDVQDTLAFLEGKSKQIIKQKKYAMLKASETLDFEQAAKIRDQIQALTSIQIKQDAHYHQTLETLNKEENQQILNKLQDRFSLTQFPKHIECFDVSHLHGIDTIASQVVFIDGIANNRLYRRFNISGVKQGDDPAAIRQAIKRRLLRGQQDGILPDLLIVDGGRTQLKQAEEVLKALNLSGQVTLLSIAKGEGRKAGLESYYRHSTEELGIKLSGDDPVAHLLQRIRDEAHRFAITGQRNKRKARLFKSSLEEIVGVGAKTRQQLLKAFGSLSAIKMASKEELITKGNIRASIAEKIVHNYQQAQTSNN